MPIAASGSVHAGLTLPLYRSWSPQAVGLPGTGLGPLVVGFLNLTHLGCEPCRRPTVRFVRITKWAFAAFGALAVFAVPDPPGYVLVASLAAKAVAGHPRVPGPA